jgi:hypothetical protein
MAKATKKEMYLREIDVQESIAEGRSRKEIYEIFSKKWQVSEKSVEYVYYRVVDSMKELVNEGREELRAKLMARNDYIYERSVKTGKFKTALDANLAQAKIGGIFDEKESTPQESKKIVIKERDTAPIKLVGDKAENE